MELLIKQYRGEVLENVHLGDICIIDENKNIVFSHGDIETETIYRSCSKPLQLLPLIINGGKERFDLNDKEITVMCASHQAEDFHIETIEGLMRKTHLKEEMLYCPEILPGYVRNPSLMEVKPLKARKVYYNCSGKHVGLMLSSKLLNADLSTYYKVDHPVQKEIISIIKTFSDFDQEIKIGIDGCGVPVYTVDLKGCASAFLKLAAPDLIKDPQVKEAVETVTQAISNHPKYIGGTGSIDDVVNSDPNLIGKYGAQGVYTLGLKKERLGVCFKMYEGNPANQAFVLAKILEKLKYQNKNTINQLYNIRSEKVYNHGKEIVGYREVTF